jgi:hypothetical protein
MIEQMQKGELPKGTPALPSGGMPKLPGLGGGAPKFSGLPGLPGSGKKK